MNNLEKEIWKDIDNYIGYYQVSNTGRVKSLDRTIQYKDGRVRFFKGNILKQTFNYKRGYYYITLKKDGIVKTFSVHKLVADTFLGCANGKVVDHIDNNRKNNNLKNLRFVTQRENLSKKENSGICFHVLNKKWTAYIFVNGKNNHLGYFENKNEAKKARLEALKKHLL